MKKFNPSHQDLVLRAESWLNLMGFNVVIRDPFRSCNKEQPDAIGWKPGQSCVSAVVECKVTRADFLADKKKLFRKTPTLGMGDWRIFFAPRGIITIEDLPAKWGLVEVTENRCFKIHGVPFEPSGWYDRPFKGSNKRAETVIMLSALRRLQIRGHLDQVYEGLTQEYLT